MASSIQCYKAHIQIFVISVIQQALKKLLDAEITTTMLEAEEPR